MDLLVALLLQLGGPTGHVLTPLHFGVNTQFFREYLALGVTTHQDQFASALRASGVKSLRFPGGNTAYYYIPQSAEKSMALAHASRYYVFRENNPPSSHFVTLGQLSNFARNHDFQLIYQLPCLFHLDTDGTTRATIRSRLSDRAENYDHDRIAEGVAYGMDIVGRLKELGAPVAMWELGNEEFAHCAAEDYARLVSTYIRELKRVDPDTPVTVIGMGKGWLPGLTACLQNTDTLNRIDSLQAHYPFGHWPGPGRNESKDDAKAFVMGCLGIDKWVTSHFQTRERAGFPVKARLSITETMAMRHKNWDSHAVIGTQAYALCYTWNWMELLSEPRIDCIVFHDCATPFFGIMRHNIGWNPETHRFSWLNSPAHPKSLNPQFPDQYLLSPTGYAARMLAELTGEELIEVRTKTTEKFRVLASRGRAVVLNRTADPIVLTVPFPVESAEALVADSLPSCLPDTHRIISLRVDSATGKDRVVLPPWSVSVLRRESPLP